jgi:hypothetical protein
MSSEFAVVDLETGLLLEGEPSSDLIAAGQGEAWRSVNDRGRWHLRDRRDPRGIAYRLVQVVGGPNLDPNWYEDTVENLETSEGG